MLLVKLVRKQSGRDSADACQTELDEVIRKGEAKAKPVKRRPSRSKVKFCSGWRHRPAQWRGDGQAYQDSVELNIVNDDFQQDGGFPIINDPD